MARRWLHQGRAEADVPSPGSHLLRVHHVRRSRGQLLETWLWKGKSIKERRRLAAVTCGPLGMLYTARLGSPKQTSQSSPAFMESHAEFPGLSSHSEAGKLT